jgi:four helix bundle protein
LQRNHELTLAVYKATQAFPKDELYGLTSQPRRASSSIPANIAEGCGRGGDAEIRRFLQVAMGSASELEYHLLLAHDLHYLETPKYQALDEQATEVKRMLASFIQKLKADCFFMLFEIFRQSWDALKRQPFRSFLTMLDGRGQGYRVSPPDNPIRLTSA